jgi:hypothetical protein
LQRFESKDDESKEDAARVEKVLKKVAETLLTKWTSDVVQIAQLSDQFVIAHGIGTGLLHLVGAVEVSKEGENLSLLFGSQDLRLSSKL